MADNEEVLAKLTDVVKNNNGVDWFRVKVGRKNQMGGMPNHVATLEDATLAQVANAEQWLPQLAGGGPVFQLEVYHQSNSVIASGRLNYNIDGHPRKADPSVVKDPAWRGPRTIINPTPPPEHSSTVFSASSSHLSPGGSQPASPHNSPASGGPPGAFSGPSLSERLSPDPAVSAAASRYEEESRRLAEQRHKLELEAVKAEADRKFEALRAEMRESRQIATQAQPKTTGVLEIIAALAPLAQSMIRSNNEARLQMMRMQEENRREDREFQRQQAQSMQELIRSLNSKPQDSNELINKLFERFEKMQDTQTPNIQMMNQMAEAFGSMSKTTLHMVQSAAEMRYGASEGQAEHPMMPVLREVTKSIGAIAEGYKASVMVKNRTQQPQQQLPQMPVQPQALPAQAAPAPAPTQPPASDTKPKTIVDVLEAKIRLKENPYDIASMFVKALGTPDMEAELQKADGDPVTLFQRRLGDNWLNAEPTNPIYAQQLFAAINDEVSKLPQDFFNGGEAGEAEGGESETEEAVV